MLLFSGCISVGCGLNCRCDILYRYSFKLPYNFRWPRWGGGLRPEGYPYELFEKLVHNRPPELFAVRRIQRLRPRRRREYLVEFCFRLT